MMVLCYLVFVIYLILIVQLIIGFNNVEDFQTDESQPKTKFSIVVPFRNEAKNLPFLIGSFEKLSYPKDYFEVILVDDASTDNFETSNYSINIQIINNIRQSNSPKKDAIETAILQAKHSWIVTTDADCVVPENWLNVLDQFIQKQKKEMVVGAVKYSGNNSFLHQFQCLDIASLQGVTIGSFGISKGFMCNGANFAYTKNLFLELKGFAGNNQIASGDDVFLLQKALVSFPEKVGYLKSIQNIVSTKSVETWQDLFFQRVRWASKTPAYSNYYPKFLGVIVFATNFLSIYLFFLVCFDFKIFLLLLLISKYAVDAILIIKTNLFLKSKTNYLFFGNLFYPFFSVAVALYALLGKYQWKGRTF